MGPRAGIVGVAAAVAPSPLREGVKTVQALASLGRTLDAGGRRGRAPPASSAPPPVSDARRALNLKSNPFEKYICIFTQFCWDTTDA